MLKGTKKTKKERKQNRKVLFFHNSGKMYKKSNPQDLESTEFSDKLQARQQH